eukprot:COSAG01_NODE_27996_length_671_cov_6.772727_1_plen_81_part_10
MSARHTPREAPPAPRGAIPSEDIYLAAFEKELRRFSSLGKHGSMVVDSQALEPGMAPRWGGVRCPPPALARPGPPHADPTL